MLNEDDVAELSKAMMALDYPNANESSVSFKITDTTWLGKIIERTRIINTQARYAIDADRGLRYWWIDKTINELRKKRATTFNFVTEKRQ